MAIEPIRARGTTTGPRSRAAVEIMLNVYAILATIVVARMVLLALSVDERVWIGRVVYRLTNGLVAPLAALPGASEPLLGQITLPDLTLLGLTLLVPLGIVARGIRRQR